MLVVWYYGVLFLGINYVDVILILVLIGELIDKIIIFEIKVECIDDVVKLVNVCIELDGLLFLL